MTTYTAIPDTDIDTDSPLTESLFTKIRDNPIAISEGAAGAPKILKAAINSEAVDFVSKMDKAATDSSWSVPVATPQVIPAGVWNWYHSSSGGGNGIQLQVYANGSWRAAVSNTAGSTAAGNITSDGVSCRFVSFIATQTVDYRQIYL